jgi:hypothetical protein
VGRMRSPWRAASVCGVVAALCGYALTSSFAGTDSFDGRGLAPDWVVRSTGEAEYAVRDGWLHVHVPGAHGLWPVPTVNMDGPMFLVTPPAVATVSFETRLRFVAGPSVPTSAAAGLIITRESLQTFALFAARRGLTPPAVTGEWWDVEPGGGGGGGGDGPAAAFHTGEDLWMRFEHRGDTFVVFTKEAEHDPWTDITPHVKASFPHMDFRFEPGSYSIGLCVKSGVKPDADVEVAFDYFRSPQIKTLGVEPVGKTVLAWAALREATW